jgi:poly-gamma-glutamate synthesis protein (capsule biosynthesis protein)
MKKTGAMNKTITFGAVGDIGFWHWGAEAIRAHGFGWPFAELRPHLQQADLLCGNMESVTLPPDYPVKRADPKGLVSTFDGTPALREAGFDLMVLANNHVLDGGHVGMFHTRKIIEALGIATVGVGRTQAEARRLRVLERGGIRFGFLAYAEDTNYTLGTRGPCHAYYTAENVLADVAANRHKVDVLVVSIHADLEFMETPSVPRRDLARQIARAGASIVLEHHPHVPQGIEMVNGCLIAYSLGNCYFPAHSMAYMRDNGPHTGHSFLLLAEVSRRGVQSFRRVPFRIGQPPNERPVPLRGPSAAKDLRYFKKLDALLADDAAVRRNWRKVAMAHLRSYINQVQQGKYSRERVLQDLLGRLLLVQENRLWVDEAFRAVRADWERLMRPVDPLHRPYYRISQMK